MGNFYRSKLFASTYTTVPDRPVFRSPRYTMMTMTLFPTFTEFTGKTFLLAVALIITVLSPTVNAANDDSPYIPTWLTEEEVRRAAFGSILIKDDLVEAC